MRCDKKYAKNTQNIRMVLSTTVHWTTLQSLDTFAYFFAEKRDDSEKSAVTSKVDLMHPLFYDGYISIYKKDDFVSFVY